eukprot:jgi/Bigna1/130266/aug1.11_g4974
MIMFFYANTDYHSRMWSVLLEVLVMLIKLSMTIGIILAGISMLNHMTIAETLKHIVALKTEEPKVWISARRTSNGTYKFDILFEWSAFGSSETKMHMKIFVTKKYANEKGNALEEEEEVEKLLEKFKNKATKTDFEELKGIHVRSITIDSAESKEAKNDEEVKEDDSKDIKS